MDDQVYEPVETAPVPLFGGVVLAARSTDGLLWLAVQDLAIALEVDARSQRRRIQANPLLNRHTRWFRAGTSGGPQTQLFLKLEGVGLWVMTINVSKTGEHIRDRLIWLQQHLEQAVRRAFAEATGLPERSSDIEDIDELGRIDDVLRGIVAQQRDVLAGQEQLRTDVADLAARLRALEGRRPVEASTLSKAQRGQIYNLVLTWADQLQRRNEGMSPGAARATCWAAFKRKFNLAEYHHLPATRYNEAVAFIREAYTRLGGDDLPAQIGMDLGGDDAE
jgi:hypothetical protein